MSSPRILAVTNLYPTPEKPTSGTFVERQIGGLRQIGLDLDVLLIERASLGMKAYWGLAGRVQRHVRKTDPDVVHVLYGGVMADCVTRAIRDRPVAVSFCGTDLLGEPLVSRTRRLISAYGVRASHRAARNAAAIVVKSRNLEEALPADVDRGKVQIIPNGVDTARFRPVPRDEARRILGWSPEEAVVLFVSVGGHPRKRLSLARAAIHHVRGLSRPVVLKVMQGVPHWRVPLWLSASDALVLTSVHEGGVNIVKEAMACNLPVVSVDVGDVRERLRGVRACSVVDDDPQALGAALSATLRAGVRSDGRDHLSDITITAVAERLEVLYRTVSGRPAPRVKVGDVNGDSSRQPVASR